MKDVKLTVSKAVAWMPVPLDENGRPMSHGEPMVEVKPGVFMDRDMYELAAHADCLNIFVTD